MSNQIQVMASVQEKVRERIQSTFADLIPKEVWESMVQQEIKEITEKLLPELVRQEADKILRQMIQKELCSKEWADFWDTKSGMLGPRASAAAREIVKGAADDLVASLFGRIVQGVIIDIRNNVNRY